LLGNGQNHELAMIERVRSSASEVLSNINLKGREDSLNNDVRRSRLSDLQNQRSCLDRITRAIPKDIYDEMKPREKGRSKSQNLATIDYSPQFIQKTALLAIQKSEQLQKKYSIEKKEWKEHVELLERQISLLKSELQNVKLTNWKKIDSQPQLSIGEKGNFQLSHPQSNEVIRTFDCDLEAQVTLNGKQKCPLSDLQCAVEMEEFTDLKLGLYRRAKHFDLGRIAKESENKSYFENFPNLKEKLDPEDSLNLQRKLQQESSRGGSRTVKEEAREYVPYSKEERGGTCKVSLGSEDLNELKKRRVPKTAFIDQQFLALSDSRCIQNLDEACSTLNGRVLNAEKERRFSDSRKMSPASTFQSLGWIDHYRIGCEIWNKSMSGIAIKSQWL